MSMPVWIPDRARFLRSEQVLQGLGDATGRMRPSRRQIGMKPVDVRLAKHTPFDPGIYTCATIDHSGIF